MKVEINLNLDEFKNLLVNCDEFRQLLATGIEEPATETVESVGGVKVMSLRLQSKNLKAQSPWKSQASLRH